MSILNFIEDLKDDRRFKLQIAGHKYLSPVKARYMKLVLSGRLEDVLKGRGIRNFYSHQVEAINLIREGENVVVMTPTASGKSLIYNIPVLESIIENPEQRALYIFPLKGLEQDQVKNLNELHESLVIAHPFSSSFKSPHPPFSKGGRGGIIQFGEVYDGDTTPYRRKKIREAMPNVIFTNPDMLHLAINPFHRKWETFFKKLKFVVVDEIHTYRGVFG
jgi:DEAD/DEAH box helicase domain-containing protein